MPPVMITWVTPTAMMPITDTCRMMIDRRCWIDEEALADEDPAEHLEDERDADEHAENADFGRQLALRSARAHDPPLRPFHESPSRLSRSLPGPRHV